MEIHIIILCEDAPNSPQVINGISATSGPHQSKSESETNPLKHLLNTCPATFTRVKHPPLISKLHLKKNMFLVALHFRFSWLHLTWNGSVLCV